MWSGSNDKKAFALQNWNMVPFSCSKLKNVLFNWKDLRGVQSFCYWGIKFRYTCLTHCVSSSDQKSKYRWVPLNPNTDKSKFWFIRSLLEIINCICHVFCCTPNSKFTKVKGFLLGVVCSDQAGPTCITWDIPMTMVKERLHFFHRAQVQYCQRHQPFA